MSRSVYSVNDDVRFPRGFTIYDNRIQDELQRHLSASAFCIWSQYLRFWGGDKKKAYPSLSYLSAATSLSERTIRKCNKELVDKKFLKKKSGSSNSSNIYYYVSIEKILQYYTDGTEPEAEKESIIEKPIDVPSLIADVDGQVAAALFINTFIGWHNGEYVLSEKDKEAIVENSTDLNPLLLDLFFKTKNDWIASSDHSVYFFFRPKTQQILKSEYLKSDVGRWSAQAEREWAAIGPILQNPQTPASELLNLNIDNFIKTYVRFSHGNSNRDAFVYQYLEQKIKAYLKR
jgi:hypothetical protein